MERRVYHNAFEGGRFLHAGDATEANSIRETSDGGYILAGYAMAYEGRDDMWIIKLNENGEIMK